MAKRTALNVARSTVVVLTFLVGILFAGHNFAFADIVSDASQEGDQLISESVDNFLTGGVDQNDSETSLEDVSSPDLDTLSSTTSTEISDSVATSTAVGGNTITSDFETGTSTSITTTEATTTLPSEGTATSTPFETSTSTPPGTSSTTNATSTGMTTGTGSTTPNLGELATSTNATSTATSTQTGTGTTTATSTSMSTSSTTTPFSGSSGENATSTTATSSPLSLDLLSVASTTVATTSDLLATSTATTTQSFRVKYYRYDDFRIDMAGWGIPFDEIQGIDPGDPLAASWTKDWFTAGFLKNTVTEDNIRFKDRFAPFAGSTDPFSDPEAYIAAPNFGAHFMGIATVSEEKDYTVTITTDGDAWFYMDRVLQLKNLSGIKPAETLTKTIHMVPGQQYILNMFFTERIALYPYFDFSFPGVTITPCTDDSCEPGQPDPDTTGPLAPVVTSPVPPISSSTTPSSVTLTWTPSVDPEISGAITSGLRGYVYIWDQISTTVPTLTTGTLTTSTSTVITNLTPGIWWFHVIAIDNAGNTSAPTTHHGPFCIGLASCDGTPPIPGPFEIRDLRATDINTTSVTIRWRTTSPEGVGHPASSRVVYDLISHSATTTAPNYSYSTSTSVSDENPLVVDHAITVTGLNNNTTYYFRAVSVSATTTVVSGEVSATTLNPTVPPVNPPSGGGGGGGGSRRRTSTATTTAATTTPVVNPACDLYLLKFIKLGADNDPVEVRKLQAFLKVFEGRDDIPLDGFYDLKTYNAVRDFQKKYGLDVLNPWGIGDPTGYVFITTTIKINYLYCGLPDRITLNLRNFYGPQQQAGTKYAAVPKTGVGETMGYGTSTATGTYGLSPTETVSSSTATGTKNSVQLAFAGITGFFLSYPWVWILLLLLVIVFIVWATRSKEEEQEPEDNK